VFYLPTSRKFSLLSSAEWKISGAAVLKCWIDTVSGYKVEVGARKVPPIGMEYGEGKVTLEVVHLSSVFM